MFNFLVAVASSPASSPDALPEAKLFTVGPLPTRTSKALFLAVSTSPSIITARPSETTSVCLNSWATRKVVKNKKRKEFYFFGRALPQTHDDPIGDWSSLREDQSPC